MPPLPITEISPAASYKNISLYKVTTIVALIGGSLVFVVVAKHVVLPIMMAVFASFLLGPFVRWLSRHHLPRSLGAGLVILTLLTITAIGIGTQIGPAVKWLERFPKTIPEMQQKLSVLRKPIEHMNRLFQSMGEATGTSTVATTMRVEVTQSGWPQQLASLVQVWASDLLFAAILAFFILSEGESLPRRIANACANPGTNRSDGCGELVPHVSQIQQIISESEKTMFAYLVTVTWIDGLLGIGVGTACWLLGMPNPILWGLMVFVINYIPYFGAVIGITILAIAGLLSFQTVAAGLAPAGAYLILNLIEGELITPLALRHRFSLDPVITVIWTALWLWLWGIPGGVFAVPLLVLTLTICRNVPSLRPVSEIIAG